MSKCFCKICNKETNCTINDKVLLFEDTKVSFFYLGKIAICNDCFNEVNEESVLKYNDKVINEIYDGALLDVRR